MVNIITERYGRQVFLLLRECEKLDFKLKKTEEDLKFLHICLENGLTPTFGNFKLHKTKLRNGPLYKRFKRN